MLNATKFRNAMVVANSARERLEMFHAFECVILNGWESDEGLLLVFNDSVLLIDSREHRYVEVDITSPLEEEYDNAKILADRIKRMPNLCAQVPQLMKLLKESES